MNVNLQIGQENQVVEVQGSGLRVNTEQPTVQGGLDQEQIENLPVNGRNFLDLAQLEPGVQIQDGANFGKDGYSSISFGGRFRRLPRQTGYSIVATKWIGTVATRSTMLRWIPCQCNRFCGHPYFTPGTTPNMFFMLRALLERR